MPIVTSENREEFIKGELEKKATGKKKYPKDPSKMTKSELLKYIKEHEGKNSEFMSKFMKEGKGNVGVQSLMKEDPEFAEHSTMLDKLRAEAKARDERQYGSSSSSRY